MTTADDLSEQKRRTMSPLRWERVRRGLTIRDVLPEFGLTSTSMYANWELGQTAPSSQDVMRRIADFYGVDAATLWGRNWTLRGHQEAIRAHREAIRAERPAMPARTPKRQTPVSKPARRIVPREVVAIVDDATTEPGPEPVSLLRRKLREKSA